MPEEFSENYPPGELQNLETGKKNFENEIAPESGINLSNSTIGFRVFKIGEFDQNSLERFKQQVESIKLFSQYLEDSTEKPPQIAIITNSELPEEGKQVLAAYRSDIVIVQAEQAKARRRAKLGQKIIGEKSAAKGEFSYSDMLNALEGEAVPAESEVTIFASSDLALKPEILSRQIVGMKVLYDKWQKEKPNQIAIVGSLMEGVHDLVFVQKAMDGEKQLDLENLHRVFPNNTLSLVPSQVSFSGITDNALAGNIEIGGKSEPIGGNEDFLCGLEEMIYNKKDCVLLVEPFVAGERQDEVRGVESKYARRQAVYRLYAERTIRQAVKRRKIDSIGVDELTAEQIDAIVEAIIDKHLFFARIDQNNHPEIILTHRQKLKSITPPI